MSALSAQHRLASYGSLKPGGSNHHQLDGLKGRWFAGKVKGRIVDDAGGSATGYLGLILGEGTEIDLMIFESEDLPAHWNRLDIFEGESYVREVVEIETEEGVLPVTLYVLTNDF